MELSKKEKLDLLNQIGDGLSSQLDKHFKQWGGGLPFKTILSQKAHKAKMIGLDVAQLADALEELKYIRISSTPTGKRYIFSGKCKLTDQQIQDWVQEHEMNLQAEAELKKLGSR